MFHIDANWISLFFAVNKIQSFQSLPEKYEIWISSLQAICAKNYASVWTSDKIWRYPLACCILHERCSFYRTLKYNNSRKKSVTLPTKIKVLKIYVSLKVVNWWGRLKNHLIYKYLISAKHLPTRKEWARRGRWFPAKDFLDCYFCLYLLNIGMYIE